MTVLLRRVGVCPLLIFAEKNIDWGDTVSKTKDVENTVREILLPIADKTEAELVDVEFIKEGPNRYLSVFVDKAGGITIDDCEVISRALEKVLDERDIIEEAYILEVSSPGIDRPLKTEADFIKYAGETVDIKLYKALDGKKDFQGKLAGLLDGKVVITDEETGEMSFPRGDVASVRLSVIF